MEMQAVESKMFRAVGYDSETQTLHVQFGNGNVYAYQNVPEDLYQRFLQAESKGKFFSIEIRNRYSSAKVEQPVAAGVSSGS